MSAPHIMVFCAPSDRDRIRAATADAPGPVSYWGSHGGTMRAVVLLAVGPEGGAALARWVAERGIDGVRGIGLVGVTAPWADMNVGHSFGVKACLPCDKNCPACGTYCASWGNWGRLCRIPLGPLEGLRAVAERARDNHAEVCSFPECTHTQGLLLIVACAPDDGVCAACGGIGDIPHFSGEQCKACDGEGKALSSRDVARELVPSDAGGASLIQSPTRAALDDHGLRAVLVRLTR